MDPSPTILVVDDEPLVHTAVRWELRDRYSCIEAADGKEALDALAKNPSISAVLLDIALSKESEESGFDLIPKIRRQKPDIPIVMLTGFKTQEMISEAMKLGAIDFIPKPIVGEDLIKTLQSVTPSQSKEGRQTELFLDPTRCFLGRSPEMRRLRTVASVLAKQNINILITGETGTGKEVLARFIHSQGQDPSRPFIAVNCAAIPTDLWESTFFGHERGAFTSASDRHIGLVERANGGDLFLDEFAAMPLNIQAKFLRVLELGEFERVGGHTELKSNFRIMAAANRSIKALVDRQAFRDDLYYRIQGVELHIPPLRERPQDIPLLVNAFLDDLEINPSRKKITAKARSILTALPWPGNVRQLRRMMQSMIALSEKRMVDANDIPETALEVSSAEQVEPLNHFEEVMKDYERQWINRALREGKGSIAEAARLLGIDRRSLYRRMQRLEIGAVG